MKKILTKRLEMFVSNAKNHIFASRFREKANAFNEKINDRTGLAIKSVVTTYRKTYKYVYGKDRIKRFLIGNIGTFEREHITIVNMIEDKKLYPGMDLKENWDKYLKCKSRISAILRANRRMTSLKATDRKEVQSYLNEYIRRRRFEPKFIT